MHMIHLRVLAGIAAALLWMSSATAAQRPFTVADSIAMTQITDPLVAYMAYMPLNFNWSPDGRWAAMVTRRGELSTGLNHYELRLFSEQELTEALRTPRSPARPPGRTILSIATSSFKPGIERISWDLGGHFLYCVGREGDNVGQVYEVELASGRQRRLTSHPTDVASYVVTGDRRRLLYAATEVQDWTQRNRRGYVVGANYAQELAMRDPRDLDYLLAYYLKDIALRDIDAGTVRRLDLPSGSWAYDYTPSPDGRYAVYPVQVGAVPARWRDYALFRENRDLGERSLLDVGSALAPVAEVDGLDPTFGVPTSWLGQYYLIDLQTGHSKPLLDAPALLWGQLEVHWSRDASSVIVNHSYLPLQGVSAEEAEHRRSVRIIAEVDVASGAVFPIADQPELTSESRRLDLRGVHWLADGSVEVRFRASTAVEDDVSRYVKKKGRWVQAPRFAAKPHSAHVTLEIRQDMNTPPDVFAVDPVTGRSVRITDLNPQLREMALGTVEPFDWEDKHGRRFHGGLMFPPNYVRGRRLPVVLQTYGFREDEFVVDGPNSMPNAYAARALLNHHLLVLQMPELSPPFSQGEGDFEHTGENPLYVAALEAAIDALDQRGYIDPRKVGLTGFSREGMHVQYSVTFSSHPIAAAIISDSVTATPMSYVLGHGHPQPGILEFEHNGIIGAPFWGAGIDLWRERSPAFHFDRVRTPMRLETMGPGIPGLWEMYMILTRHRRPVELVHIPREMHPIQTPWGRYTSQQGAVDWFAFWLNGTEDPDPAKKAQYERWRIFRQQQAIAEKETAVSSSGQ